MIKDYRLLISDGGKEPTFQLVTVYADKAQFDAREANFDLVFAALRIPRPLTVDGKSRDDIFSSVTGLEDYRERVETTRPCRR